MSLTYSAGGVMPTPQLAWNFDGTTTDYVSGVAPTTTNGTITYGSGKYGQAFYINGGTSNIIYSGNITDIPASGGMSLCFWWNPTSTLTGYLLDLSSVTSGSVFRDRIYIGPNGSGNLNINFQPVAGWSSPVLSNGTWYHFTIIATNTAYSVYYNGVFQQTVTASFPAIDSYGRNMSIGNLVNGTGTAGNGLIDDLRIYNTALTAAQVQATYSEQGMPGRGVLVTSGVTGGDTVQNIGGYRIHTFTTTGTQTFTVSGASITGAQMLVVAGGGGGGQSTNPVEGAAGGGAGGLVYVSSTTLTAGSYIVTVGAGGGVGASGTANGLNGGNSSFSTTYVALGGGGGGAHNYNGSSGGSGGGAGGDNVPHTGGSATQPGSASGGFGNAGGNNNTGTNYSGGGGGGAGAAGSPSISGSGPTSCGGPGGIGLAYSISGTSTYYAGGGAGGDTQTNSAAGGLGGGGAGAKSGTNAQPGTPNTGGGGGGAGSSSLTAAAGGSGIVIIAYPYTATSLTGTPLFSQLSQAARTSAVGAFSLRAVNGVSVKAVQVRSQGQFPPVAMTSNGPQNMTGYSFGGSGNYTASASTGTAWSAFDNNLTTVWLTTGSPSDLTYNTLENGGAYIGSVTTTIGGVSTAGEWIQLELPSAITIVNYSIYPDATFIPRMPRNFTLAGSNDVTSWTTVNTQTNITSWSGQTPITFTVNSSVLYKYFRLVVTAVVGSSGSNQRLRIPGITYIGSPPAQDFYADQLGNLLTAPVTGLPLVNWLGGTTGYVATWYDQSGAGQHMEQTTASLQPIISLATTPASLILSGNEYFQNTVPFTFNFGSGAFTLRYVVSNNTGGLVVYKADSVDFVWSGNEKKFWLGNGTSTETSQGGYPSQVGNSENYILSGAPAIGSTKTSVVHKATSTTAIPIYVNGTIQTLATNALTMGTDPGNFLYFGMGANASNYIGNLHEIEIFSTALLDADRLILEGIVLQVTSGTSTVTLSPGTYTFRLAGGVGGTGGNGTQAGGRGMILSAVFTLTASTSIKYVVGGSGGNFIGSGGGGGGSYVYDLTNSRVLFVAAGGGGAGSNSPGNNATGSASPGTGAGGAASYASGGGGGGGLFGNGTDAGAGGGKSFLVSASPVGTGTSAGGTSAFPAANGGFGGGGAGGAGNSGGGGGGYTGGNQLGASIGSNGGTSYVISGSTGLTESATNTSSGYITVSN